MKFTTRNLIKGKSSFFVVTRDGRRIEEKNYETKAEAEYRADVLYGVLKEWDRKGLGNIGIVQTSTPYRIH